MPVERLVVHAEERAPKDGGEGHGVVGIGDGAHERQETAELLGILERATAGQLVGNSVPFQRARVLRHVLARAEEDEEVLGAPFPAPHGRGDRTRDARRVLLDERGRGGGGRSRLEAPEPAGRTPLALGREGRRRPAEARSRRKLPREDAVDPVAEAAGRGEVRGQGDDAPAPGDPIPDGPIGLDVPPAGIGDRRCFGSPTTKSLPGSGVRRRQSRSFVSSPVK